MLFVLQIHRPKGLHYDEKNARYKKKKIRQIETLIESQDLNPSKPNITKVCKEMVVENNEEWWYTYKYRDWFINREIINKLPNNRFNIGGQGRKMVLARQLLYSTVNTIFKFWRCKCKVVIRQTDVSDYFIIAAHYLRLPYSSKQSIDDAKKWTKKRVKSYSISQKIHHKKDYIAAMVGEHQKKLRNTMEEKCIPKSRVISLDETMLFYDFQMKLRTLSYPGQNEPVAWIPNEKDTKTMIGIWSWNGFVNYIFR